MRILIIKPPLLCCQISPEERLRTLVMFDLEPDFLNENAVRLDIDVVFHRIAIQRGNIPRIDYYVGTTCAAITVELEGASITGFSDGIPLGVDYTLSTKRTRESSVMLKPGKDSRPTRAGFSFQARKCRQFTSRFENGERLLNATKMGENMVQWDIVLPRGEKAVRDFLLGNLHLYVECVRDGERSTWPSGTIRVRPSDILFFDGERRPMSRIKSVVMRYLLWRGKVSVRYPDGIPIWFGPSDEEAESNGDG